MTELITAIQETTLGSALFYMFFGAAFSWLLGVIAHPERLTDKLD